MDGESVVLFFNIYLQGFVGLFMAHIVMINSFKLRVSKKKAYVLAFLYAQYLPITDTLAIIYVGGRIIPHTGIVYIFLKVNIIIQTLFMLVFVIHVIEKAWYRCFWWIIFLSTILPMTLAIYIEYFMSSDPIKGLIFQTVDIHTLPKYLLPILVAIVMGLILLIPGRRMQKVKKIDQISKWTWYIIYIMFLALLLQAEKDYFVVTDSSFVLLVSDYQRIIVVITAMIIVMLIGINQTDKRVLKIENELLMKNNEQQYENYLALQKQRMEIHKLYHDIGNHIKTIQLLVINGDIQEAKDYAEDLLQQYHGIKKDYYSNHRVINAVLMQKMKLCDENGIKYEIDLQLPDTIPVRDIDLMSIFSNLIDNAIEGCLRNSVTDKYIHIKAAIIDNYLMVKIRNSKSKDEAVKKGLEGYITRKKEKRLHGYGLKIVEEIVNRYEGQEKLIDLGNEFSAMVMLDISSNEQIA
ncbi:MAG: GHKL domain-containing protein [Clostridiales bacterium]|nr:GHKL domain-containing protein [Clostridiales bacterium]